MKILHYAPKSAKWCIIAELRQDGVAVRRELLGFSSTNGPSPIKAASEAHASSGLPWNAKSRVLADSLVDGWVVYYDTLPPSHDVDLSYFEQSQVARWQDHAECGMFRVELAPIKGWKALHPKTKLDTAAHEGYKLATSKHSGVTAGRAYCFRLDDQIDGFLTENIASNTRLAAVKLLNVALERIRAEIRLRSVPSRYQPKHNRIDDLLSAEEYAITLLEMWEIYMPTDLRNFLFYHDLLKAVHDDSRNAQRLRESSKSPYTGTPV